VFDRPFIVKSIMWYPNHFCPVDKYNKKALANFSHIASLCPTDTELLSKALPDNKVEYIPHIIDFETKMSTTITIIRDKYGISHDAYVILINCGNYDFQNRKSLDTSIFACEEFMKGKENVILFIHTYDIKSLNGDMSHLDVKGSLRIDDLLEYSSIPAEQVIVHKEIVPYNDVLDMMRMSDVLLQGSKSEGFGVPVLEAQLLGCPVITTKFGAMSDYTFNGISVPYVQKCYDNLGGGIWVTPSVTGMTDALNTMYSGSFEDSTEYAKEQITKLMSRESVTNRFLELITDDFVLPSGSGLDGYGDEEKEDMDSKGPTSKNLTIVTIKKNKFIIGGKEYVKLKSKHIKTEWIMINDGFECGVEFIEDLINKNATEPNELILLKTRYKSGLMYPTVEHITAGDIKLEQMNYCVASKYLSMVPSRVRASDFKKALLEKILGSIKVGISDNVICTED